ncbi:hypothetical protein RhiirC2_753875 [Rhizophagus irregularis]|uniref:Uncharacterized protein n=1 Tax=Rhizophagus irregularis TaxID=588596 RepID=A0A2N1MX23_9GLOM|nr:hypothetical protein RhiirC2_753875 [Rhizophagus irregularis]
METGTPNHEDNVHDLLTGNANVIMKTIFLVHLMNQLASATHTVILIRSMILVALSTTPFYGYTSLVQISVMDVIIKHRLIICYFYSFTQ